MFFHCRLSVKMSANILKIGKGAFSNIKNKLKRETEISARGDF